MSTAARAGDVARSVLGHDPDRIEHVPTKSSSVWRIREGVRDFYVKFADLDRVRSEAWFYGAARTVDVPVPPVLAQGSIDDAHYLVTEAVIGRALKAFDPDAGILRRIGEHLRRLHELQPAGFGILAGDPPAGPAPTWHEGAWKSFSSDVDQLARADLMTQDTADVVQRVVEEAMSQHEPMVSGRLLHGDLATDHMILRDEDADCAFIDPIPTAGDPALDLAWFAIHEPGFVEPIIDGYGQDARLAHRVLPYALLRVVGEARWCLVHGSSYEPVAGAVDRILRQSES